MQLSINTDFQTGTGDPSPYLKAAADAGFTHIHWCHQWCTDFIYTEPEIKQIEKWFKEYGLQLLDLHGSVGPEKNWMSEKEYERKAGVELVINRLEMTARLGGDAVVMHTGADPIGGPLKKSLDELEPTARKLGVKIAVENGYFDQLAGIFELYSPEYVGLCYDSGHANMTDRGVDQLEEFKDRLCVTHLHDNNRLEDEHKIPLSGTIDWMKLMDIIARSAYKKCLGLEVSMRRMEIEDVGQFAQLSYEKGAVLTQMLENART